MTHTQPEQLVADHLDARRKTIIFAFVCVAVGAIASLFIGASLDREIQQETNRADNALVALEQACDQVERFGGHCVTEPTEISDEPQSVPGPAGNDGIPGRPPTQAEIAAAVAAYLQAHPPEPGLPGPQGPQGDSATNSFAVACQNEGGHLELRTFRLANGGTSVRVIACVSD